MVFIIDYVQHVVLCNPSAEIQNEILEFEQVKKKWQPRSSRCTNFKAGVHLEHNARDRNICTRSFNPLRQELCA
jgi:hypothetical protein